MSYLDESKLAVIAFYLITCRNRKAKRRLIKHNIDAPELPGLSRNDLSSFGFAAEEIENIKNRYLLAAEEEAGKAQRSDIEFIFKGEEYYPPLLAEIYDPPGFIYALGDKTILNSKKIAVVGSRQGSSYGWLCLQNTLPDLCEAGLAIVSGMAYGIDSMAHKIALKEEGKTIGVNAGGLLNLYPPGNRGLIDKIIEKGCIISEFALDTVPRPFYFPIRNRIIAGISQHVLVVEAAKKSGSLITARLGLEQGKDILAFPGRIDSPLSRGTNYLIQQGAKSITAADDILEEYGIQLKREKGAEKFNFSKKEEKILDLMALNELNSIDYFVENIDFSVSEIISLLMGLILKNVVFQEAGGYKRNR
ncbi:MAG: DNA-processing protein DprA [Candidatus Aminicenantes bacterium]|nr:DNA-processing protein DprA [Candidatus Aminicenantes bacterium]